LGLGKDFWNGKVEDGLNFILAPVDLTVEKLKSAPEMKATVPAPGPEQYRKHELGLLRSDKKPGFPTSTGKVEIYSTVLKKYGLDPLPTYKEPLESPISTPDAAKKYPLIFNTGSRLPFYTHSKLREIPWLREMMPNPVVRLHPQDAAKRGIQNGDDVMLETSLGSLKFKAEVTNLVLPGVIDVYHGWEQANVNKLIARKWDPISGYPGFKEGLCEIRKA
jgi:anaerobic selenocysteine-containing dehydrogenase